MKRILIIAAAVLAAASIAYAAGIKCYKCKGTGWDGSFKCLVCGGDGEI